MGNKFETECTQFLQQGAQKLNPPQYINSIVKKQYRSPFSIYKLIRFVNEKWLNFSYLIRKQEFLQLAEETFGLDPTDEGKRFYKLFKVKNAQGYKVVNVLEILSVIILLADFGQTNEKDLMHNAEMIEHKINLMLVLFDLRDSAQVNVVEVMIMSRTVMQGFSKVYPNIKFFSNQEIIDEIRPSILNLFTDKIEFEIKLENQQSEKLLQSSSNKEQNLSSQFNESLNPVILGKQSSIGLGQLNMQGGSNLAFSQASKFSRRKSLTISGDLSSTDASYSSGSSMQVFKQEETLTQKKQRLFKWNNFQNIKIPIDYVKQQLLKNTNFIRFISLFENFDQVTMGWGCNHWFQQGIYLQKDFSQYYKTVEQKSQPQEGDADVAYRELAQINAQAEVGNDQILMFQQLLQKWQEKLNTNWSVNFEYIRLQQMRKCKYERKTVMEDPSIILSLLNSQIIDIKANGRFTTYRSADGLTFMMGRDYRPKQPQENEQSMDIDMIYGIPKCIDLPQKISQIALGINHLLFLSKGGSVYSLGSNQFGQLGVQNSMISNCYEHPLALQKLYYSSNPIQVPFFNKAPSDKQKTVDISPVQQIACGDDFCLALTQSGKLYSWGLSNEGRLGTRRVTHQKILDKNSYTCQPQKLQFTTDSIDRIHACGSLAYCEVTNVRDISGNNNDVGCVYIWGKLPQGVNMKLNSSQNDVPQIFTELFPYNFSKIYIQNDFALGMGHTVKINIGVPGNNREEFSEEFSILAIPNYDGQSINNVDDLTEAIQKISDLEIKVMNDFDVPWVTQQRMKFPKVPKRRVKKVKQNSDDEDMDEDEEEEDEEDEEEDEDAEEEDEEDEEKSGSDKSASDNQSNQQSEQGSDDDEDGDKKKKAKKEEKSPTRKALAFMTGVKGQKGQEKPKKKSKATDDEDDSLPYDQMSEEQKRNFDVQLFQRNLNRKKTYFMNIEQIIVPITEAKDLDEYSNEEQPEESPVQQQPEKVEEVKKKKDSDEESGSAEESGEGSEPEEKTKIGKKKGLGSDEEDEEDGDEEKKEDEDEQKEKRSSQAASDDEKESKKEETQSETQYDSEEEETEQQANEREYIDMAPTEPEVITFKKMKKIAPSKQFDGAKCIFINYTFENDYNHILSKLLSLFNFMPNTLQLLIVSLEPNASKVNSEFAEHFQRLMQFKHQIKCQVLFIRHEDKQKIISHLFTGKGQEHRQIEGMKVRSVELNPDTLLYSWGNARDGKLGISDNYATEFDQDQLPRFYLDDKIEQNNDDFETFLSKKNVNIDGLSEQEIENLKNLMDFQSRLIFTPKPQPIVKLIGMKATKIVTGQNHTLFLSQDHEVYAWGSNEQGQLGINKKLTEKTTEFTVFQTEEEFNQEKQEQTDKGLFNEFASTSSIVAGGTQSIISGGGRSLVGESTIPDDKKTSKPTVNFANVGGSAENKGLIKQVRYVQQHYAGVPTKISTILGRIEDISCGDQNSFAIVKI